MATSVSLESLNEARKQTDSLFALLPPENLYARPIDVRHRVIFYMGHLENFDWLQLERKVAGQESFHPAFDQLFEAGIDPPLGQLPRDAPQDWPEVSAVREYVGRIREKVDADWESLPAERRQMVLEHRHMHAETFSYMLHNLPHEAKLAIPREATPPSIAYEQEWISIPAGRATLGLDHGNGFGWDNEFSSTAVDVPTFRIQKYKVSNGDFLEFMTATGASAPHFWKQVRGAWHFRGMFEMIPLPLDWPVWVTQAQASAYAAFRGAHLPTEAQYHRAAFGRPDGAEAAALAGGNSDYRRWNPEPVTARPETASPFGVAQLNGNGWEWTQTPFAPLPGFQPADYYPAYSANFFDNQHYVIKGASPRTAAALHRRSLRNWFRGEYPYLYAGFRLVENGRA